LPGPAGEVVRNCRGIKAIGPELVLRDIPGNWLEGASKRGFWRLARRDAAGDKVIRIPLPPYIGALGLAVARRLALR